MTEVQEIRSGEVDHFRGQRIVMIVVIGRVEVRGFIVALSNKRTDFPCVMSSCNISRGELVLFCVNVLQWKLRAGSKFFKL